MAARIRIFFVDGRGEHANRAEEKFVVLVRGPPELDDEFLDVACHVIESFGELTDFGGALHWSSLVEFATADGQRRRGEGADWRTDADCKQVAENQRRECDDHHELERLRIEFRD